MLVIMQVFLPRRVPRAVADSVDSYVSWHHEIKALLQLALLKGFTGITSVDLLESLGAELDPARLSIAFDKNWRAADKTSEDCLEKTCMRTISRYSYMAMIPRLLSSLFLYSRPFLLRRIIHFFEEPNPEAGLNLVILSAILFLGNLISNAAYIYYRNRVEIAMRGMLSFQVFQKTSRIGHNRANASPRPSLVDDDITSICQGIAFKSSLLSDALHVFLGVGLLFIIAGAAGLVDIVIVILSTGAAFIIGKRAERALLAWRESRDELTAEMINILPQLQVVKMLGLKSVVTRKLRGLQTVEQQRWLDTLKPRIQKQAVQCMVDVLVSVCLVICLYLVRRGNVFPALIFPTLTMSFYVQMALLTSTTAFLAIGGWTIPLKRVQDYLLQGEAADQRTIEPLTDFAFICTDLAIAPEGFETPLIQNINLSIPKGQVTLAVGPSGCGKSTLLRTLAGTANIVEGSVQADEAEVAYCDEVPWLRNVSIQDNIVAGHDFDPVRYDTVIQLCLLQHDIRTLEQGHAYITGFNGINLSGGQRQRVVSGFPSSSPACRFIVLTFSRP